jgi:SAM-dependent methyltransferase
MDFAQSSRHDLLMPCGVHQRTACRGCARPGLKKFLSFDSLPFTDEFVPARNLGKEFRHPLDIHFCASCFTVQTQHDVEAGDYYADYQYSVGASGIASAFMDALARGVDGCFSALPGRRVLEVGSGDGEQLAAFRRLGWDVLGYEPSSMLCRVAEEKGVPSVQGLFTRDSIQSLPLKFQKVHALALSYTFDHLPEPREFLVAAREMLDPEEGLLVVEVHDLEKIFSRREYCLFEHEHSVYLTQRTAAALCAREGLTVIDFDLVPEAERRANSLLFVATPRGSRHDRGAAKPATPPAYEDPAFYGLQAAEIAAGIARLDAWTEAHTLAGRKVAGYGAGGRGVMTLAAMRTAGHFRYLVDRKPKHVGVVTPKSGVPVVGLDALARDPVDAVLVFSFGYLPEIRDDLVRLGYRPEQLVSLLDVLVGG